MASVTVRGHFDGKQILLDEPFELRANDRLLITVISQELDASEKEDWRMLSHQGLRGAYAENEPEYTLDMIKEPAMSYGAARQESSVTKEKVKAEIDNVPERHLEELLHIIKRFEAREDTSGAKDILESLSEIKIQGPEDFSENIDLYLTGERTIEVVDPY
ncbi:MAG: hypothetical protein HY961_22360 [Ignavibacteriae bacterium]|nr:hypothetical protein [Ignavibacteriota bacterium]